MYLETIKRELELHGIIVNNMAEGVCMVRISDGIIVYANPKFEKIFDYSPGELNGKSVNILNYSDEHVSPSGTAEYIIGKIVALGEYTYEVHNVKKDGTPFWCKATASLYDHPEYGRVCVAVQADITERKRIEEDLKKYREDLEKNLEDRTEELNRIKWLLTEKADENRQNYMPPYGNLIDLNKSGEILDSVGKDLLCDIISDHLDLLDTSSTVYEKNGDYALRIFSSGYCQFLDSASRSLCNTDDNKTALLCDRWLCHNSCWSEASKIAIETGKEVDIECNGGRRIYAIPVYAGGEIAGSINFSYGDPPEDIEKLRYIAEKYKVSFKELCEYVSSYDTRPPYLVELAKKRLHTSARLTGEIIERKRVEKLAKKTMDKLSYSEKKYRELIETSQEGIWIIDGDCYTTFVNSRMAEMMGYTPQEMMGKHLFSFMSEDYVNLCKISIERKKQGLKEEQEFELLRKDGSKIYVRVSNAPLMDDKGNYKGAFAFISDITEYKKSDEELREAMLKYQTLFDAETDSVMLVDRDTCDILEVNRACVSMYGYSKEELLSMKHFMLSAEPQRAISAIKDDSKLFFSVRYHKKKDGTVFPTEIGVSRFTIKGRNVMLSDIRDITERVNLEEALSYRLSIEKLLTDLSATFIHIPSCDVDREVKRSLKTVGEFLDFDRTYIVLFSDKTGNFIKVYEWCAENIQPYIEENLRCLSIKDFKWVYWKLKRGEAILVPSLSDLPSEAEYEKEFWAKRGVKSLLTIPMTSGTHLTGYLGFSSIKKERNWKEEDLNFIRLAGEIFTHVLERKHMEDELRQREEKLKHYSERLEEMVKQRTEELEDAQEKLIRQEKLAVLGKLAGSVGHELRNPLGVISNAVYYLQLVYSSGDENLKDYLSIISGEVKKSDKIISDLLDFARIKSIDKISMSLDEIFTEVFRVYSVPEHIQIINRISSDLPYIYGDRHHIIQIFGNLIINAFQSMPSGGVLTLSGEVSPCGVRVSVADTGCGISKEHINKIFEPLFTTKPRGIGLGLCVCKNLLDANGGKIEVESTEHKGTVFTVTLPVKEVKS